MPGPRIGSRVRGRLTYVDHVAGNRQRAALEHLSVERKGMSKLA